MFDGLDPDVQAHLVAPGQLMVWAERIRPHLAKITAESGGRYADSDLLTAIAGGRIHLWLGLQGTDLLCVALSEIHNYPRLRAMRVFAATGRRPAVWRRLMLALETTAKRDFGCALMECVHQPRFGVLLLGWRATHTFSEKVL